MAGTRWISHDPRNRGFETGLQFQSRTHLEAHLFQVAWRHHNPMLASQEESQVVPEVDVSLELERTSC